MCEQRNTAFMIHSLNLFLFTTAALAAYSVTAATGELCKDLAFCEAVTTALELPNNSTDNVPAQRLQSQVLLLTGHTNIPTWFDPQRLKNPLEESRGGEGRMMAFLKYLPAAGYSVKLGFTDSYNFSPSTFQQQADSVRDYDESHILERIVVGPDQVLDAFKSSAAVVILGVHHKPLGQVLRVYGSLLDTFEGKIINVQCHSGDTLPSEFPAERLVAKFDAVLLNNWKQVGMFRRQHPKFQGFAGVTLYGAPLSTHSAPLATASDGSSGSGSVVFVGTMRNPSTIRLITQAAELLPDTTFDIIVGMTTARETDVWLAIQQHNDTNSPSNINWLTVPKGGEDVYCAKASIALDFSWTREWTYDNSKVSMYLSYGLDIITTLPSPSMRFLAATGSGAVLPPVGSVQPEELAAAIRRLRNAASLERKQWIKLQAQAFISWKTASQHLIDMLDALLL